MEKDKQIPIQCKFKLSNSPQSYIISMYIRNLMCTYGEEYVREIMRILFLSECSGKVEKKAFGEEL